MSAVPRYILKADETIELPYYGIYVFSSLYTRQKLDSNRSLGQLILFLGLSLVVISSVDISRMSSTLTQTDQSIWPSSGKGIWIGLFLMAVGVFALIAVKEKSHSAFYILLPYTIVGILLSFFGLLSSIAVLQRYTLDPVLSEQTNRSKEQGLQFALSGLLIAIFALAFLFLSCLSCVICWTIPSFCARFQGTNPRPFHSSPQRDFPLRTSQPPRRPIRTRFPRYRYPITYASNRAHTT